MKTVIIDDDKRVCRIISDFIESNFPEIKIIAIGYDLKSGYELIKQNSPELVFLDINLPDGTGFDLLKKIDEVCFKVIFITGHEEYAIQAIKFSALDFILKPIDFEELASAIAKALEIIHYEEERVKIKALLENYNETKALKRLILKTSDFIHVVKIDEIIRCKAENNYTFFYIVDGEKILVSKTIKEYTELLKTSGFLRVHQSHLINAAYIDKFVRSEGGYILMKDQTNIPVSTKNKQLVINELENLFYK